VAALSILAQDCFVRRAGCLRVLWKRSTTSRGGTIGPVYTSAMSRYGNACSLVIVYTKHPESLMVSSCTTRFNYQDLYFSPAEGILVCCVVLRRSGDCFNIRH